MISVQKVAANIIKYTKSDNYLNRGKGKIKKSAKKPEKKPNGLDFICYSSEIRDQLINKSQFWF